jgi:ankyrin repeat protein
MNRKLAIMLVATIWSNLFLCGCGNGDIRNANIFDAAKKGDLKTIKILLKKNPDLVNSKDVYNMMPLHYAASFGWREEVFFLLDNKADVNAKNIDGTTPLLFSAYANNQTLAEPLIAHKADVNVKDNKGVTPLHWAARMHNADMVELLLTNKADIDARDNNGETPLHWAAKTLSDATAGLLKHGKWNTDDWLSFSNSLDEEYTGVAGLLLTNKADVNATNNNGETPLHLATDIGEQRMVDLLRQHGGHE